MGNRTSNAVDPLPHPLPVEFLLDVEWSSLSDLQSVHSLVKEDGWAPSCLMVGAGD